MRNPMLFLWLAAGSAVLVTAAPTGAATLEGRILFAGGGTPVEASLNPYPGTLEAVRGATPQAGYAVDQVVVFLEGTFAQTPPRGSYQLTQRAQAFVPQVLAVPVGAEVGFPNFDPVFHNVFSYSRTKRFDLGRYGKGKSKSVRFDEPGIVQVFCEIHSNMAAHIFVAESGFVTQPDAQGRYVLRDVPAGEQTLTLWHPSNGFRRVPIEIDQTHHVLDVSY